MPETRLRQLACGFEVALRAGPERIARGQQPEVDERKQDDQRGKAADQRARRLAHRLSTIANGITYIATPPAVAASTRSCSPRAGTANPAPMTTAAPASPAAPRRCDPGCTTGHHGWVASPWKGTVPMNGPLSGNAGCRSTHPRSDLASLLAMRAARNTRYGPPTVVDVVDTRVPEPGPGEIQVKVNCSTVTRTDCGFRAPHPWFVRFFSGVRAPRRPILGSDFAGVVSASGPGATSFEVGDRVFGSTEDRFGTHAEMVTVHESDAVAPIPLGVERRGRCRQHRGVALRAGVLAGRGRPAGGLGARLRRDGRHRLGRGPAAARPRGTGDRGLRLGPRPTGGEPRR